MKGANLLIFKNQEVKLGDLGISVKLSDTDTNDTDEKYSGKGVTLGYVTPQYQASITEDYQVSKRVMFNCDKYAITKTFKRASARLFASNATRNDFSTDHYYYKMLSQLQNKRPGEIMSITQVCAYWAEVLANDFDFAKTLCEQMIHENKQVAIRTVFQVYKHRDVVQHYLDDYRFKANDLSQKAGFPFITEDNAQDRIEKINIARSEEFYLTKEQSLKCKDDDFKIICINVLKGWPWTLGLDYDMRKQFAADVKPLFYINEVVNGKEVLIDEGIIEEAARCYRTNWQDHIDESAEHFDYAAKYQVIMAHKQ